MRTREGLGTISGKVAGRVLTAFVLLAPAVSLAYPHGVNRSRYGWAPRASESSGQHDGAASAPRHPNGKGGGLSPAPPPPQTRSSAPVAAGSAAHDPSGPGQHAAGGGQARPLYPGAQQEHLNSWIQGHGSFTEQQKALRSEPGFNRLPPQMQQRLVQRLHQIDAMPPEQRQRTLNRIEAMERLSPERRREVIASAQALRSLPPDRQRMLKKAIRDLREYPPQQREALMSSRQFQGQFNPQERNILGNVLAVEPYEPHAGGPEPPLQSGK